MIRRIFIAINIDDSLRKFITKKIQRWQDLPVEWMPSDNYHLTLAFLGKTRDEQVGEICQNLRNSLAGTESFDVNLSMFAIGPNIDNPKMLWIKGEKNADLIGVKARVESAILERDQQEREFSPHINLGKIGNYTSKEAREIFSDILKEKIAISLPVDSVEIMESVNVRGERKYFVLETIALE